MDRLVEVNKARMAFWTFLALAMLTLTGVAVQNKREELLFLAAFISFFALFVDLAVKYRYATPFLYRTIRIEHELFGADATSLGLLSFGSKDRAKIEHILSENDEIRRQRQFRLYYVTRGLVLKVAMCTTGAVLLIILSRVVR